MKEIFKNDHIKFTKNRRIRALSPLWWGILIIQSLGIVGILYIFAVSLWILMG